MSKLDQRALTVTSVAVSTVNAKKASGASGSASQSVAFHWSVMPVAEVEPSVERRVPSTLPTS